MKMTWMKKQSTNKNNKRSISHYQNLPFDKDDDDDDDINDQDHHNTSKITTTTAAINSTENDVVHQQNPTSVSDVDDDNNKLAKDFEEQGNKLAENGKFREALGKWEAALMFLPERAALHEQKAQVLLELGEAWNALKAATRATELEPTWSEAWITLGRAQLNYGEPDRATESFDKALALKPDSVEAREDRQTATLLVKKRKQLHSTGLSPNENRFVVQDKAEGS